MESFLISVERQAYRMALIACRNQDDALDLVQDAFCRFVDKYSDKPPAEWKPLFYRIMHNRIRDFHRRQSIRLRWRGWLKGNDSEKQDNGSPLDQAADSSRPSPEQQASVGQAFEVLKTALQKLPFRQQQAFLLRTWEELSVAETADVMGCSQGSVKTHLSRAVRTLKAQLGEYWP